MARKLTKGRFFSDGNGFSTGHLTCLPKYKLMIDIDRLKLRAEMSITKEGALFIEYSESNGVLNFEALFSLKHRNVELSVQSSKKAFDFVDDLKNRVMRGMAKKLKARLFVVLHGDGENPPFDFSEVDTVTGAVTKRAHISGNTVSAWEKAYEELGLLR